MIHSQGFVTVSCRTVFSLGHLSFRFPPHHQRPQGASIPEAGSPEPQSASLPSFVVAGHLSQSSRSFDAFQSSLPSCCLPALNASCWPMMGFTGSPGTTMSRSLQSGPS